MIDTLLLLNAGSSSIKFALYPVAGETPFVRGQIAKSGGTPQPTAHDGAGHIIIRVLDPGYEINRCVIFLLDWLGTNTRDDLCAIRLVRLENRPCSQPYAAPREYWDWATRPESTDGLNVGA